MGLIFISLNLSGNPLVGEEGYFAFILTQKFQDNNFLLIGQIDSQNLYLNPDHPILMYKIIDSLDFFSRSLTHLGIIETQALRLTNLISLIPIFYLYLFVKKNQNLKILKTSLIILIFLTPIFKDSFFKLQTDTLVGSTLFVAFAFLITLSAKFNHKSSTDYVVILAGVVISIGKQEWSLFLLTSLFVVFFFYLTRITIVKSLNDINPSIIIRKTIFLLVGVLLGNSFSYIVDPINYVGGLQVMKRVLFESQYKKGLQVEKILEAFDYRFHFLSLVLILICIYFLIFLSQKSNIVHEKILLLSFSLISLIFPFLSLWNLDLRYFVPGFILSVYTLIWLIIETDKKSLLIYLLLLGIFLNLKQDLSSYYLSFGSSSSIDAPLSQLKSDINCINIISSAEAFLHGANINWVSQDLDTSYVSDMLKGVNNNQYITCASTN